MGLFKFNRRKHLAPEAQQVISIFSHQVDDMLSRPSPQPISTEEYAKIRKQEVLWLEKHYDFNSIEGIEKIPSSGNLPKMNGAGVTGEVFYYMKKKAHQHEADGNITLAIACMRKSIELTRLRYGDLSGKDESYSLVGMLARNGFIKEAISEKAKIEKFYKESYRQANIVSVHRAVKSAHQIGTDLLIMSAIGHASPEIAAYQGRVYSISGKNKRFPKLPDQLLTTGTVEKDNPSQLFPLQLYPFVYNSSNPNLEYTLSVHPLKKRRYGKNIVSFSRRPFVDDRTEEYKKETAEILKAKYAEKVRMEQNYNSIIEREAEHGVNLRNYKWIQTHIPEKCPKSYSGYMRMKKGQTKKFLILQKLAKEQGKDL